jgi:AcrR family transcriptional regulator
VSRQPTRERRTPHKGDQRRAALLESLDHHLQESSLESINIADISRRAGVTRSAFYFYFENKAVAAAALMEEMYDEIVVAAGLISTTDGPPATRIETMIRELFAVVDRHAHQFAAMLETRATSEAVRTLWESDRQSFVEPVAEMIRHEREVGGAPDGPDATVLATVLLELNDRMLERTAVGGPLTRDQQVEALTTIWLRTIFGTDTSEDLP